MCKFGRTMQFWINFQIWNNMQIGLMCNSVSNVQICSKLWTYPKIAYLHKSANSPNNCTLRKNPAIRELKTA